MMTHLDGNALAGRLAEILMGDVTSMRVECAQCGAESSVAETLVTLDAARAIAQCPACTAVMLALRDEPAGSTLDLRGIRLLRSPSPGAG
jgi:ribosomal protein S27AE